MAVLRWRGSGEEKQSAGRKDPPTPSPIPGQDPLPGWGRGKPALLMGS